MVTLTDAVNPDPVISMTDPPPVPPLVRFTPVTMDVRLRWKVYPGLITVVVPMLVMVTLHV